MLNNSTPECMQIISTITYSIWLARNNKVFQKKHTPAEEVVAHAMKSISEYHLHLVENRLNPSNQASSVDRNSKRWSPPPSNFLKLKVDAHLSDDGRWGFGLIVRRADGRCVGAATRVCAGSQDVAMAEATGLKEALQFVEDNLLSNLIIELDANIIVQALNRKIFPRTKWGNLVRQCSRFLSRSIGISAAWVNRKSNQVAHTLARWALVEPNRNWSSNFPYCILTHIQNDMRGVS
ncbi:ribonuclease H protein [Trifolium medium]|uniref:Ribonuclease H protein n=1 Tax=Trifolium medium TaxID=97028 RepID=A0A392MC90_9FABA|nr:ribonuclease H protein [Trifolium medium]